MHHYAGAFLLNQSKENFSAAGKTAKYLSILFQVKFKRDVINRRPFKIVSMKNREKLDKSLKRSGFSKQDFIVLLRVNQ